MGKGGGERAYGKRGKGLSHTKRETGAGRWGLKGNDATNVPGILSEAARLLIQMLGIW